MTIAEQLPDVVIEGEIDALFKEARRRRHRRIAIRFSALGVVGLASLGLFIFMGSDKGGSLGGSRPLPAHSSSGLTAAHESIPKYFGHPVGVPDNPVDSVSQCPASPQWSSPLPAGAKVTITLVPASVRPEVITGGGTTVTIPAAGRCMYTVISP